MPNVFIQRLEAFGVLPAADIMLLDELSHPTKRYEANVDVISEGEIPDDVHLVMSGLACRYKLLDDGKRQLVAFLLPGEFCDLHVFILDAMDHSISTIAPSEIVRIPRSSIVRMLERPALARALWMATLVDEAVLREWVLNLGQRRAHNRLAHLFCELFARMTVIEAVSDENGFDLPISQTELGETVGLSLVHVNKSLKKLREAGAVTFKKGQVVVLDQHKLRSIAGFNSNYLHHRPANARTALSAA